jgi:hypothetical protein
MTKSQIAKYWQEWRKVAAADPAADRHALHVEALGFDKSSREFSNEEFDKVLAVFWAIIKPANLHAQVRQENQPRQRLIWVIQNRLRPPEAYLRKVCSDKFRCSDLNLLTLEQLQQLRFTLTARRKAFRGNPEPAPAVEAQAPAPMRAGELRELNPELVPF